MGPGDEHEPRARSIRRWAEMLECRIGADGDPMAVLDPSLRVRGVTGLRVADASVFPAIPSVNPVITVMLTAERAADLISQGR